MATVKPKSTRKYFANRKKQQPIENQKSTTTEMLYKLSGGPALTFSLPEGVVLSSFCLPLSYATERVQ